MKIYSLLTFAAVEARMRTILQPMQVQGVTDEGTQFSAEQGPSGLAYQEGGESLIAAPGKRTDKAIGFQSYCLKGKGCYTAMTQFADYKWDGERLSVKGKDKQGTFKMFGNINNQGLMSITKQYLNENGVHTERELEVYIETKDKPNEEGLILGRFKFTSNRPGYSGKGRSAAAFVESAQTSFDSKVADFKKKAKKNKKSSNSDGQQPRARMFFK